MIAAVLTFLSGPLGKIAAGAALVVVVVVGWVTWLHSHDAGLRAEWTAQQTAAVAAAVEAQRVKGDRAAVEAAEAAAAAARLDAPVREIVRRVPIQTACAASPGVAAAVNAVLVPIPGAGAGTSAHRVP